MSNLRWHCVVKNASHMLSYEIVLDLRTRVVQRLYIRIERTEKGNN